MERKEVEEREQRPGLDSPEQASAPVEDEGTGRGAENVAPGPVDAPDETVVGSPWWESGLRPDEAAGGEREAGEPAPGAPSAPRAEYTEYVYRGVRYGGPGPGPKSPPPEEPDRDDDPVDATVLAVMSEDPPPAPPAEGDEAREAAADSPWWEGGEEPVAAAGGGREAGGETRKAVDDEPAEPAAMQATPESRPALMPEDPPPAPPAEGGEARETGAGEEPAAAAGGGGETGKAVDDEPAEPVAMHATPEGRPALMPEDPPPAPPAEEGEAMAPITAPPWWQRTPWSTGGIDEEPDVEEEVPGAPHTYTGATYGESVPEAPQALVELSRGDELALPDVPPEDALSPEAMSEGRREAPPSRAAEEHAGKDPAAHRGAPDRETPASPPGLAASAETLPEGPPRELIRSIVSEVCPSELLLVGTTQAPLPEWAGAAVTAARNDLERRLAGRKPVDGGECLRLAIVEHVMGLHEEADGHLKEALPRSDQFGPVLNALAVTSLTRGKIAPAIVYCKEALRETGGDDDVRAAASSNLGDFYRIQGDAAQAAEAYETAIGCLGPQGESHWLSRLHLRLGNLYRGLGRTDQARLHLADSVRLSRDAYDQAGHVQALAALGSTLTEAGLHDAALRNFEEAVRICLRTGDKPGAALVQDELGIAYTAQDQLTRALAYFESALYLHRELGDREGEAATLGHMRKIHDSRGDNDEARRLHEAALEIDPGQGPEGATPGSSESGDRDRARLRKAEDIFNRAGSAEQQENERRMPEKSVSGT